MTSTGHIRQAITSMADRINHTGGETDMEGRHMTGPADMTAEKIFKEVRFNHEPSADLWLRLGEMCKQEGWRLSVSADMGDEGFRLRLREFIQDPKRLSAMAEYLECGYREIWSWAEGCLPHQLIRMQAESFMGRP